MKTYNSTNFFKHTYCEFEEVMGFDFPDDKAYKSKGNSFYYYTKDGVYRKSNHWGRVANCRWKLISKSPYKNQVCVVGFAKWSAFTSINSNDKRFYIEVDLEKTNVDYKISNTTVGNFLFSYSEVLKRVQEIKKVLAPKSWISYLGSDTESLKKEIINDLINSSESLVSIKQRYS